MAESSSSPESAPPNIQLDAAIQARLERDFSFDGPASWYNILRTEQQISEESMAVQAVRTGLINPFEEADRLINKQVPFHSQHLNRPALSATYQKLVGDSGHETYSDFLQYVKGRIKEIDGRDIEEQVDIFLQLGELANATDIHHLIKAYLANKTRRRPDQVDTAVTHMKGFYRFLFSHQALQFIDAAQALDDEAHITPNYHLGYATEPAYQDPTLPTANLLHASTHNQDAMVSLVLTTQAGEKITLIAVADGISGSGLKPDGTRHSQLASTAAVRLLAYYVQKMESLTPEALAYVFAQVNEVVAGENYVHQNEYALETDPRSKQQFPSTPVTTLSAMILREHEAIIGSVGDSYLSIHPKIGTHQQLVEPDKIGPNHPLVRFIGNPTFRYHPGNFRRIPLQSGDILTAHTDGTSTNILKEAVELSILYRLAHMQPPADFSLLRQREENRQRINEALDVTPQERRRTPPGELWDDTAVILAQRI